MKTQYRYIAAALCLTFFVCTGQAQEQPAKTPEPLARLFQIEGCWEGPAELSMNGKTYRFTYSGDFRPTADGSGLSMDESFTHPELGTMKGANLIGYNANDGKIHWMSVDNFGTTHEHLGRWLTPQHFTMQANEIVDGKKFVEDIDLTFPSPGTMNFHLKAMLDGQTIEEGSASFTRRADQAKK
ncbi:MAG: hypothetical protein ACM3Q4_02965 [Acidobacteriota bacterium]